MVPDSAATLCAVRVEIQIGIDPDLFFGRRYSQTVMKNPHFAKMAEAFGVRGIRCEHKGDVEKTVKEMLAHKGPVVVDFFVEPNEHVYPMVPSGKGLHEMELGTLA